VAFCPLLKHPPQTPVWPIVEHSRASAPFSPFQARNIRSRRCKQDLPVTSLELDTSALPIRSQQLPTASVGDAQHLSRPYGLKRLFRLAYQAAVSLPPCLTVPEPPVTKSTPRARTPLWRVRKVMKQRIYTRRTPTHWLAFTVCTILPAHASWDPLSPSLLSQVIHPLDVDIGAEDRRQSLLVMIG
jgi:hypothetical protein